MIGEIALKVGRSSSSRFTIYALTIAMCVICYGDRAVLSVGMPLVSEEFGLTPATTGWVLSSFLWSYVVLNLPSAMLLDHLGSRRTGAMAVGLWSLAMILGGFATTIPLFILTRVLLGIGEAPTFSLGNKVMRIWAPETERGVMMTAFICGIPIGLSLGSAVGAWLIACAGWRSAFVTLGLVGFVWSAVWLFVYPEDSAPVVHRVGRVISVPTLFRSSAFWGIVVTQCCANYANFLLMSWLPIMLRQVLHLDLTRAGIDTGICYMAAAVISITAGRFGEYLVAGKKTAHGGRRYVVCLYMVIASLMGLLPFCTSAWTVLPLLSVSMAFMSGGTGANMALMSDLVRESDLLGSVTGLTLTFSNGLGIFAPVMTGYLLQATGNFHLVFYVTAALVLCGAASAFFLPVRTFHALRTDHPEILQDG